MIDNYQILSISALRSIYFGACMLIKVRLVFIALNKSVTFYHIPWLNFQNLINLPRHIHTGKGLCEGDEGNPFLFKCNPQYKCEQNFQVHHGQAL